MSRGLKKSLSIVDVAVAIASKDSQGRSAVAVTLSTFMPNAAKAIISCVKRAAAAKRYRQTERDRGRQRFAVRVSQTKTVGAVVPDEKPAESWRDKSVYSLML